MSTHTLTTQNTADNARLAAGMQRFQDVMHTDPADFIKYFEDIAPDFGKYILEWEFGSLYGRDALDAQTREIVIIASCATLGSTGMPAVKMHIRSALHAGVSREAIVEVLMQLSFSAGLPTAITALEAAREVFQAIDHESSQAK